MTDQEKAFFVEQDASRLLPYVNLMQNAVTYEMSLDQRVFIREVFTFLDLLGDLGGLLGALTPICVLFVSICQY